MSKRKEITSYFQPKKKQTTTCEDEEPSAASIEVTGDGVEPLIVKKQTTTCEDEEPLKNLSTLGDLCHGLVTTGKADMYPLVDRLLRLVLTLPASTATSERAFSAMKIVKTSLRNRMEDEFLRDYLIVYIEKEIADTISTEEIIDSFYLIKERRAHLK